MTFDQWMEGLFMVKMCKGSAQIWLADFIGRGMEAFPREDVEQAVSQLEFAEFDIIRAIAISSVPKGLRAKELTAEHLFVLGASGLDSAQMLRWAKTAVEHTLSAVQLKDSIATGKVLKLAANTAGGRGLLTIQGVRAQFDRWWTQVETSDPVEKWPTDRKAALLEELKPSLSLGIKLAKELGVNLEVAA
ncbi:MAG: hypothetical protein QOE70_1318 [Chthoniobacter sp.]|nr:hypothetical protein [Chthoniobacter sp.]